ncbi:unnamed protein product [Clonostachys rosea]|uniref:Uncharacterized protein n=1 Tax=Bionectria ochroleuca TaxID=29856 RepID=A0ABY6V1D6_BIOOC|nr:unnamed protein product [Clonostachys rosea]
MRSKGGARWYQNMLALLTRPGRNGSVEIGRPGWALGRESSRAELDGAVVGDFDLVMRRRDKRRWDGWLRAAAVSKGTYRRPTTTNIPCLPGTHFVGEQGVGLALRNLLFLG